MKRKFIDVVTKVESKPVDVLSVKHSDVERLMAILQLAPVGSIIEITVNEEKVETSSYGFPITSKDA